MNYIDVYFSRVNHLGETAGEVANNAGIRSFERWLNESPNTIHGLSVDRGLFFDGIILTNKDKEQSKIMTESEKIEWEFITALLRGDIKIVRKRKGTR